MLKRLPLLIAVLALAIWLGNFIIKNFLATSLIAYGETAESRELAAVYSPSNPAVIAARAKYLLYRAEPTRPDEAIAGFERAVELAPRDYRFWLELGRAYENLGQEDRAEKALEATVKLAPGYFETRWALANFLVRRGKSEQALEEYREAIVLSGRKVPDEKAALNVYNSIASATEENFDILRRITAADDVSQSLLARFFASRNALDQALEIWRRLQVKDEDHYRKLTVELLRELEQHGHFTEAREVWKGIESLASREKISDLGNFPSDLLTNGGFERKPICELFTELADSPVGFDWIIRPHSEVRQRLTGYEKHSGAYSLYLGIAASMNSEFNHVSQVVAVEPRQSYRLTYFVKTKNIPTEPNDAPFIEVSDAIQPNRFTIRSVVESVNSGWEEQAMTFTIPPDTRGLQLRIRNRQIVRVDLSRITEVWFDDFRLEIARQ